MGMEARLFLGPRDGEVVQVVEAKRQITVMAEPLDPDRNEYTEYVYERAEEPVKPGVYIYNYAGPAAPHKEDDHEGPED
jgi:hypothetical protein